MYNHQKENPAGDRYVTVDVCPSCVNFAMYVKQRKAAASKMKNLGGDRQLTISHECQKHDCKMAR